MSTHHGEARAEVGTSPSLLTLAITLAFLASALLSVWAAYDRGPAWPRCAGLAAGLAAAYIIGWSGRRWGERALRAAGVGCAALAAAVALYFLLAYQWSDGGAGKFALLHRIGLWIQAHRPALPLSEDINGNVAGGALAILIPLGLTGAFSWACAQNRRRPLPLALTLALTLTLTLTLALTASRGAWAGIVAGGAIAAILAWQTKRPRTPSSTLALALTLTLILFLASALIFAAAVATPGFDRLLGGVGTSVMSRAALWRGGLALAGDTPFTGAGFGSTMMAYSTYVLLLHVGFITHSHNLFLQIALEQGVPGLIAFIGLVAAGLTAAAAAGASRARAWQLAAAASLVALVVHGTIDAGLYVSRLAPVLFLPLGFAWGERRDAEPGILDVSGIEASAAPHLRIRPLTLALTLALTLTSVFAFLPATRAALRANLAAVAQDRAELAIYEWPAWPIQDALRRSPEVDLAPAVAHFRAALALNPASVTANRRLGQIALARGEEAAARRYLEAAYAAAPGQRATRQLLGEVYAIAGEIDRAAGLWRTVDFGQNQISGRVWWYEHLGEPEKAANIQAAAAQAGGGANQ